MSEANKLARQKYWASMTPQQRTERMRKVAVSKQKKLSFKEKRKHALMMVAARRAAAAEGVDARKRKQVVV